MNHPNAAELLSHALKNRGFKIAPEELVPIVDHLVGELKLEDELRWLEHEDDLIRRQSEIEKRVDALSTRTCNREALIIVLLGLREQQREAVFDVLSGSHQANQIEGGT